MLRLFSAEAQGRKPLKPCRVGIHWIALAEYSQMSTHVSGFSVIFQFFLLHFVFYFMELMRETPKAGRHKAIS